MDNLPIFAALKSKMQYLGDRARLIAQNVANADTPGYRAKDLKKFEFSAALEQEMTGGGMRLKTSSERHLEAPGASSAPVFEVKQDDDVLDSVNGNSVSIQEQMMKSADTQMRYGMATSLYRKSVGLVRTALSRG